MRLEQYTASNAFLQTYIIYLDCASNPAIGARIASIS